MMKPDGTEAIRTLVIAPHMDDEVLGAGGLIRKRICCQQEVAVVTCFGRRAPGGFYAGTQLEYGERQKAHFLAAKKMLGYEKCLNLGFAEGEPAREVGYYALLDPLETVLGDFGPTEVVIPSPGDLNQDHRFLYEVCRIMLRVHNRKTQNGPIMRVLEMVAHDRIDGPADANYGVVLTDKMGETVIKAMRCYEDEMRGHPHPRSPENIWARWRFYGAQFGFDYVEPFRLVAGIE